MKKTLQHGSTDVNYKYKKTLKALWPFFMDGVQLPQGYSHYEEAL